MSDGITEHVTYQQRDFDEWRDREIKSFLSKLSTKELVDELCTREGVKEIVAYPYDSYRIVRYKHDNPSFVEECGDTGPARILVVTD